MNKKIFSAFATIFAVITALSAVACGGKGGAANNNMLNVTAVSPEDGKTLNIANDVVARVTKNYKAGAFAEYQNGTDKYAGKSVKLRFAVKGNPAPYTVRLSLNSDMSEAEEYRTENGELELYDLYTGAKYYWTISAETDGTEKTSRVYGFETDKTPRTIALDGISNTRDIGGYAAENGKRIREGLIYRGANVDGASDAAVKKAKEVYGIKAELDLRETPLAGGSPFGNDVKYRQVSGGYYTDGDTSFTDPKNAERLAESFRFFTEEDSYPAYFHCAIGRDRTGCLSMIILAVCGVSEEDILLDYELSALSESGSRDKTPITTMLSIFANTLNYIKSFSDKSLQKNAETFLLERGVKKEEIDFVKNKLLY